MITLIQKYVFRIQKKINSMILACDLPSYIGDGFCDDETNNEECEWDGGDCCGNDTKTDYCTNCKCKYPTMLDHLHFLSGIF